MTSRLPAPAITSAISGHLELLDWMCHEETSGSDEGFPKRFIPLIGGEYGLGLLERPKEDGRSLIVASGGAPQFKMDEDWNWRENNGVRRSSLFRTANFSP
ncbi:predicted protein [Histoplasma capsulatum var. duboisii H88]|uniref:Predicted protein n=2 Tax=Ajellomyces capsulatus TaxID=5037 RepID=F0UUD7_AJEC8|nr:predicted protein [Histoplasma capsulatum H143]EGC49514.1 predicted protein [Histoplasma capsulatum var. duboisii H88]